MTSAPPLAKARMAASSNRSRLRRASARTARPPVSDTVLLSSPHGCGTQVAKRRLLRLNCVPYRRILRFGAYRPVSGTHRRTHRSRA
jgi:hypothetical protein